MDAPIPSEMDATNGWSHIECFKLFLELPTEAFPELPVDVTLRDIETWQLSQSWMPLILVKWMPQMLIQQ